VASAGENADYSPSTLATAIGWIGLRGTVRQRLRPILSWDMPTVEQELIEVLRYLCYLLFFQFGCGRLLPVQTARGPTHKH
jgi:hypothetical protein